MNIANKVNHVDWRRLETAWIEAVEQGLCELFESNPDEKFYCAAFWLFYGDYTMLGQPCVALAAESDVKARGEGIRWTPPNWRLDMYAPIAARLAPHYLSFQEVSVSDVTFERLYDQHFDTVARACVKLTERARSDWVHRWPNCVDSMFLVAIIEERDAALLRAGLRKSVAPTVLSQFPTLAKWARRKWTRWPWRACASMRDYFTRRSR